MVGIQPSGPPIYCSSRLTNSDAGNSRCHKVTSMPTKLLVDFAVQSYHTFYYRTFPRVSFVFGQRLSLCLLLYTHLRCTYIYIGNYCIKHDRAREERPRLPFVRGCDSWADTQRRRLSVFASRHTALSKVSQNELLNEPLLSLLLRYAVARLIVALIWTA